jgi:hypothetical protein
VIEDIELPGPAWKLKEIIINDDRIPGRTTFVIYQYATFRTNEELFVWQGADGRYSANLTGTEGKDVTDRLSQSRWADLYLKAIAGQALLGRKPEIIEQIF